MSITFTDTLERDEISTITNGLTTAARTFEENAAEFRKLADYLRTGGTVPLFAEGEAGALAADRLAEQFDKQARDSRALAERLDEADSVTLNDEEE